MGDDTPSGFSGDELPIFGNGSQDLASLPDRIDAGLIPLLGYGLLGQFEQAFLAPTQFQIPLLGGFTFATPWAAPWKNYVTGIPGQSQAFQWEPHLAGQPIYDGSPIRSHTSGILYAAIRWGVPYAYQATELVHPGTADRILAETVAKGEFDLRSLTAGPSPVWDPNGRSSRLSTFLAVD